MSDPDKRLQALWVVCNKLPKNSKTNLRSVRRKGHEVVDSSVASAHKWLRCHAGIW